MQYRVMGRSGLRTSELGFGAFPIGGRYYGQVSEEDARAALSAYLDGGGNHIDTARGYGNSEDLVGAVLAERGCRDQVVLCSKTGKNDEAGILAELDDSLRRLRTDHLDVYYIHNPPEDAEGMERTLAVFARLRSQGRIRAIGASIKFGTVHPGTQDLIRRYIADGRSDVVMLIFSMLRQANRSVCAAAAAAGVALVGRTCLESGFLTGKMRVGDTYPDGDIRNHWKPERRAAILAEVDRLRAELVRPPFTTLAEVSARYVLDEPGLACVLLGAKTADQSRANLRAATLPSLAAASRAALAARFAGQESQFNPG